MRKVLIALGCVTIALVLTLGVWGYRHWWVYYRLFFANTAGDMTYEESAHALALGGTDALSMMVRRLSDEDPGAAQLTVDALEIMHSVLLEAREYSTTWWQKEMRTR